MIGLISFEVLRPPNNERLYEMDVHEDQDDRGIELWLPQCPDLSPEGVIVSFPLGDRPLPSPLFVIEPCS